MPTRAPPDPAAARFVAVDWGTTSFRAALVGADGRRLAETAGADGILAVAEAGFAPVLERHVGPWLAGRPGLPVLLAGMIGSRNGWVEVPHVPCPAGPDDLARGALRRDHGGHPLVFVPGLSHIDADGMPDVMRGEEVQAFGATAAAAIGDAEIVLPGTHSKWVSMRSGRIVGFRSYMTGELFAAIRDHTIIGRLAVGDDHDADAFLRGVDCGRTDPALSHAVFTARTLPLTGRLAGTAVASYLSGVLIGAEFAGALPPTDRALPHLVVGEPRLAVLYRTAAARVGLDLAPGPSDAAVAGLVALADRLLAGADA